MMTSGRVSNTASHAAVMASALWRRHAWVVTGTPVNDLSPILPLTQLVDAPKYGGLAFRNTAAARADRRIAEIAGIQDDAKRATDLCAYLKNVTPT